MRRFILGFIFALGLIAPAHAVEMLLLPITRAVSGVSQTFQIRPGPGGQFCHLAGHLDLRQRRNDFGFYVQTSLDGGVSWIDIAHFGFNTAASTRSILNVLSAVAITTG